LVRKKTRTIISLTVFVVQSDIVAVEIVIYTNHVRQRKCTQQSVYFKSIHWAIATGSGWATAKCRCYAIWAKIDAVGRQFVTFDLNMNRSATGNHGHLFQYMVSFNPID